MLRAAVVTALLSLSACAGATPSHLQEWSPGQDYAVAHTEAEWRDALNAEQYRILRTAGTERAFTGPYWDNHARGVYHCAGCGQVLFRSEQKFDSGTGWPSYWAPAEESAVLTRTDRSFGATRTELLCSRCGGHLGHVFPDGPAPTGERYCINGGALTFEPAAPPPAPARTPDATP